MARPDVFFHVHVRKCGGSTFHSQILKTTFGKAFYRDSSLIDYQYTRDQVAEILENCPWLRAYSSHKITLDLPYERPASRLWAISFVRDPIARFQSHYFYLRQHAMDWDPKAKQLSLGEYARHVAESGELAQQSQFSQLHQLTGYRGNEGLDRVKAFLETEQVFLAPIERYDEACLLLERLFPDSLPDCRYQAVRNRSVADQEIDEPTRELLRAELGEPEFELSSIADQRLSRQLLEKLPDAGQRDEALGEYRQRCLPPSRWQKFWNRQR